MRNLKLVRRLSADLRLGHDVEEVLLAAVDPDRDRAFFLSSANQLYEVQLPAPLQDSTLQTPEFLPTAAVGEIPLDSGDVVVAMEYLMEEEALLLGTSYGYILVHSIDDRTTGTVGQVCGGVRSIAASPDGALLSISAGLGQILIMNHDWEVLAETSLSENGEDGSGFLMTPISWRGDGKYFATLGAIESPSGLRKLMVWERESWQLQCTSEARSFLGTSLDWMPSGAKITAAISGMEGKCPVVAFFERNGLERSSFPVGDGEHVDTTVRMLKWSCNSELLAITVASNQHDAIKIWSFSNNHWYLKQEFLYPRNDGVSFAWDPVKPLRLIIWTASGTVTTLDFLWVSAAIAESSIASVIDGHRILVTPLNLSLIPPPMCLFKLRFRSAVSDFTFTEAWGSCRWAVVLSDGSLSIAELPETDTWDQFEDSEIVVESFHPEFSFDSLMHLTWIGPNNLLAAISGRYTSKLLLEQIQLSCSECSSPAKVRSSGWHVKFIMDHLPVDPVISICANPVKIGSAFVQVSGGGILEYISDANILRESCLQGFPSSCPSMKLILVHQEGPAVPSLFGLAVSGKLYYGSRLLSHNCLSFAFYSSRRGGAKHAVTHLVLTTKQDLLFVLDVGKISSSVKGPYEPSQDHVTRVWEKGAKIATVLHGDQAAVILQTSRGNLECIYPRTLVLTSIADALSEKRFGDAMVMVRRHRVDLNVIVDYYGWKHFVEPSTAAEFVRQVSSLSHVTEFICALKNDNIVEKLYQPYLTPPCVGDLSEKKVSLVLAAIRESLVAEVPASPSRELCILTTLARSEPPMLEDALLRIKSVRESEMLGANDGSGNNGNCPSSEESLKHLLWLTSPEAIFDAALGLYDLSLAAVVALNSQKDPKEFLPYLERLQQLPPAVMKYEIDMKLCRYESALMHIVLAGADYHEACCMKLLNDHPELFPLGLQLFTANSAKRAQVLEAWGDLLCSEKRYDDAAMAYLGCGLAEKAFGAYRAGGDWQGLFMVAGMMKMEKDGMLALANEVCEEFQALGKSAEAARIAIEYCGDVTRGAHCYIAGREWEQALRVAHLHGRDDLVCEVKDAALECAGVTISEYKEGVEKVGKYMARYLAVRQRRLMLAAKVEAELANGGADDDDASSVASTSFSGMSAYTTRSSKGTGAMSVTSSRGSKARGGQWNRKKGGKIRVGSPGEEMALVEHIRAMSLTPAAQRELRSLILVLLALGHELLAQEVQLAGQAYELSQEAAVRLAEDTVDSEKVDEAGHTLEVYTKMLRAGRRRAESSWQVEILCPP